MQKPTYTHKGWLVIAPIYMTADGADIIERPYTAWLLDFSIYMIQFINEVFDADYPFRIRKTGKLKTPIHHEDYMH